ncbi:MAG TPA: hypothetical protein V6D08_16425 [Candidatus Obscuribacterales bacterium]
MPEWTSRAYSPNMKQILTLLAVCLVLPLSAMAQGLIGAPDESQRPVVARLELERARMFHHGLKDLKSRIIYGSVVWDLANKYESLNRWQDALAAENTFDDLKLPANALQNCEGCVFRATDEIFKIDRERLRRKIDAIETVDHVKFDKEERLPIPPWGDKQKREYERLSREVQLPNAYVMTLQQLLKH